ncbi:MAG: hypothetical protein FJX74_17240 [Armatimonadetes bacterium]|nr:hypothetical protein [Armatimonadota bacterium]
MRIEHQGYTEVQPVYGHVGYVSAATNAVYLTPGQRGLPSATLALMAVAMAVALMTARRARNPWVWGLAALAVASGLLLGGAAVLASSRPQPRFLRSEFVTTLYRLEQASAVTEEWAAAHGRLPSGPEWRSLAAGKGCAFDGWGAPLRYERLPKPGEDGQRYRVTSVPERHRTLPRVHRWDPQALVLSTPMLGPDGLYSTQDDHHQISMNLGQAWDGRAKHPHARAARVR